MSPAGFRWFVCAVVVALVAIMLVVVRGNANPSGRTPALGAGRVHGDTGPTYPRHVLLPQPGRPRAG